MDLVHKISSDNGSTWSPLRLVHSASNSTSNVTIGNPAPLLLAPRSILLPFCVENHAVGFLRSTDAGSSWSPTPSFLPPSVLPPSHTWVATGPPGGLRLSSTGRLLVPMDVQAPGVPYSSGALLSDDSGASWSLSSLVAGGNEAQAVALPWRGPGALHLSMRAAAGARRLGAQSTDGGSSWGAPFPTIAESECEGSITSLPLRNGGPVLVMSSAFSATARKNMTLHTSRDDGATWVPEALVYSGAAAYSSIVALNDASRVGLLYEVDSYKRIVYSEVSI